MQHVEKAVKVRKVILFTVAPRLKEIGEKLEESGVKEVIRVLSIGGSEGLISAVKQHKDAGALIVYGAVIRNTLLLVVRKLRAMTKAPILLVMMEKMPQGREQELKTAGATEVLAKPDVIDGYEVMEVFDRMVARLPPPRPRPNLRLVGSDERAGPLVSSVPPAETVPMQAEDILALVETIEHASTNLRHVAESMLPTEKRQPVPLLVTDANLVIRPSNGQRGPNVTLYGRRLHLTDPLCRMLDILYSHKDGVTQEQMYSLGIPRNPTYISVAIANLRRRLLDADSRWQNVVQHINGKYILDFARLAEPEQK